MSMRRDRQGFILLPVVLILAVIGSIALMLNQKSVVALKQTAAINDFEQARYVAEAGLVMAGQALLQDDDCAGYSVAPTGSFNGRNYTASVSPDHGSPVMLNITVEQEGGVKQFSREVRMFETIEQTLNPTKGTHIRSTDKSTNYSTEETLHVNYSAFLPDRIGLLEFDFSSMTVDIDALVSVSLELHLSGAPDSSNSDVDVSILRLKKEWVEDEATYNERKAGVVWTNSDLDFSPAAVTSVDEGVIGWNSWDVKDLVTGWLDGAYVNYGFELWGENGVTNNLKFINKNHSDSTKHPILRISTLCECGHTCP